MTIKPFPKKQRTALNRWCASSPHSKRDAVICGGASGGENTSEGEGYDD